MHRTDAVERREGTGPYLTGPARPEAATPGNRDLPWRAAGFVSPSRAPRKRSGAFPALHPLWGKGKREKEKGTKAHPAPSKKQGR
jgi:hypothetical protein